MAKVKKEQLCSKASYRNILLLNSDKEPKTLNASFLVCKSLHASIVMKSNLGMFQKPGIVIVRIL